MACNLATSNTWAWKLSMTSTSYGAMGMVLRKVKLPKIVASLRFMRKGGNIWFNFVRLPSMQGILIILSNLSSYLLSSHLMLKNLILMAGIIMSYYPYMVPPWGVLNAVSLQPAVGSAPFNMNGTSWNKPRAFTSRMWECTDRPRPAWTHLVSNVLLGRELAHVSSSWTSMVWTSQRRGIPGSIPSTPNLWLGHGDHKSMCWVA